MGSKCLLCLCIAMSMCLCIETPRRVLDPDFEALKAFRAWMATAPSFLSHEEHEDDEYSDYETMVPPVLKVGLNLSSIKQHLKKLPELSQNQKRVMCEVTGEQVDSTKGAANALIR